MDTYQVTFTGQLDPFMRSHKNKYICIASGHHMDTSPHVEPHSLSAYCSIYLIVTSYDKNMYTREKRIMQCDSSTAQLRKHQDFLPQGK